MKKIVISLSFLFSFALVASAAQESAQEFFKGKTIRLVVGNSAGGAMDDWGRFLAQYLGKHIPGNPDVIVQNMPGAGAIIAANYIYNIAKPDGLTVGVVNPANYIDQLLGSKDVKFDWPKFSWIGSPETVDQGPSTPAPDAGSVYAPGCWVYRVNRYFWRPGFWVTYYPNWVWIPAQYVWTPAGCVQHGGGSSTRTTCCACW